MEASALTGNQRARLRGLGQQLSPSLKLGREGVTPAVVAELNRLLKSHELVKVRFVGTDRDQRAASCERLAADAPCTFISSVGHTALFYRENADLAEGILSSS